MVSILNLGTTVGENYHLLKSCRVLKAAGIEIEYVGLELDRRLVAFAKDIFRGDPNFKVVHGEVSDLSRFPDQCFDLVTSHHVHSYATDQPAALKEAVRVSRVAAIVNMAMTEGDRGVEFSHASNANVTGSVFKAPSIKEFVATLSETDIKFIYFLSRTWRSKMKIDNSYMGKISDDPYWHNFIVSRYNILNPE